MSDNSDIFDSETRLTLEGEFSESFYFPEIDLTIDGIFDETFESIDQTTGAKLVVYNPRIIIPESRFTEQGINQFSKVIVKSINYLISEIEKAAGPGLIVCYLKKEKST